MRDVPAYAEAVQSGVVGGDPLGLAPTNERLYNSALPGINNYVRYIRVYSAICWMTKQVSAALEKGEANTNDEAKRLFAAAIQKIELALVWVNREEPDIAGKRRKFPKHNEPIELSFETFGVSEASLFAAVTYKPSLTNGLRFLKPRDGNTYGCLPYGEALADAFDEIAKELPDYLWLKAPNQLTATREKIASLAPALDVNKPSPAERAAFIKSFFPCVLGEDARNDDRARWLTLNLMLRAVDAVCRAKVAAGKVPNATVDEIRACMARGRASNGLCVVNEDLRRVQAWWAVLQVRQLQRLCLEALYCVAERWISDRETDGKSHSLEDCVRQLSMAGLGFIDNAVVDSVSQLEALFHAKQGDYPTLYEASAYENAEEASEMDVFTHIDRLKDSSTLRIDDEGACIAVANAYIGLVFCAVETANLARNPDALQALEADGDTCSLLRLADLVNRLRADSSEYFIGHLVKDWVLLRHFEVVASRSVAFDGKNRFRFIVGDYGLERFIKSPTLPLPALAEDKLKHALLLCKQANLLSGSSEYELTKEGRNRLR